jgi:SAM-dependent methyltransferase
VKNATAPAPPRREEKSNESYDAFAYAYDRALGERFFQAVRSVVDDVLDRYPADQKTHLDVACGTGMVVNHFTTMHGYQSIGVDASVPMLGIARDRARNLVAGDYRALPFRRTFSRITCLYDSLNHVRDRIELTRAFHSIQRVMTPDSLFLFDMNHPDIYPEVWGSKAPFVATGADYHLEMATSYRKRDNVAKALVTGWAKLPRGKVAIHELHQQRAFSEREIVECLDAAHLKPIEVLDFDPYDESNTLGAEGVKLFFVCRTV